MYYRLKMTECDDCEGIIIDFRGLAEKAGNILDIDHLISGSALQHAQSIDGLAIGEIAGRDSIAAIIKACRDHGIKAVLPTIVFTGTEYGDWDAPERNIAFLKSTLGEDFEVLDSIHLGEPSLWAALNGRFASVILAEYGLYSPCLACHLYMHLCRVPLSLAVGSAPIISGERNTHQGCVKLSQTPLSIEACKKVLEYAGIELLLPIRAMENNSDIAALIGPDWEQEQHQLRCVLSGNYKDLEHAVLYDNAAYHRFIEEFYIPSGIAIIDALKAGQRPDYFTIVKQILSSIAGISK